MGEPKYALKYIDSTLRNNIITANLIMLYSQQHQAFYKEGVQKNNFNVTISFMYFFFKTIAIKLSYFTKILNSSLELLHINYSSWSYLIGCEIHLWSIVTCTSHELQLFNCKEQPKHYNIYLKCDKCFLK